MAINATTKAKATQDFVPIKEVRDGIVILKDGGMRAVVMASSINFALKSEDNQTAIISQFQNFLNSLDFSVQIFLQSRRLDIRPYTALLEERYKVQTSDLMKIQIREYIEFVRKFSDDSNIMSKTFFVIIPYSQATIKTDSLTGGLFGKGNGKGNRTALEQKLDRFEENRSQIEQRVSVVEQGLLRCGIRVGRLGTEEIVELFYKLFNPGETEKPMQIN